jgi:hypothetical protein
MNILVVCHDYKKHNVLTLVLGKTDDDYIYLTPDNIANISSLTQGSVANISFIDTDEDTVIDNFQYQKWDDVPEDSFDFFYTIFCPGGHRTIKQYQSKLKSGGKIIDMDSGPSKKVLPEELYDTFFPFIVSPWSPSYEEDYGPVIYFLRKYDKNTQQDEKIEYVRFDKSMIPIMEDNGKITMPERMVENSGGRRRNKNKKKGRKTKRRIRKKRGKTQSKKKKQNI